MSCPDCAKGGLHEGTPEGREEVLHGFQTYVTRPSPGTQIKGEIVYLPDALGWKFNNSRILFYGKFATPRVTQFLTSIRAAQSEPLPIGAAGFCWGGKFVFLLCGETLKFNGRPLIDFGFTAHPSNLVLPLDAENVRLPISVAVGDIDVMVPIKKAEEMKSILEGKGGNEVVIIPGAAHGFATRAKPEDEKGTQKGVQAEDQAVNWFNRCFDGYKKPAT
ncbi:putative protein AIM2 [Glarea lozoyensis 74030]|uniref:Dienelactone hydrolase domain-containing protein n=1 Tax=Glarea lozoyensis (strain ATCC 74030 / MF5533) TaxID=1104152 RepID=H0EC79_GLAL7|nr:putative protein AIM2 [Glarea lozoyensis 74030]